MLSFPHDMVINKHINIKKVFAWCVVCTDIQYHNICFKTKECSCAPVSNGTTILYSILYYRIKVKKKSWYIYDHTAWILLS